MSWIKDTGPLGDVVLSSRVRLARNLSDTPFPPRMDESAANSVIHRVHRSIQGEESPIGDEYQFFLMRDLPPLERQVLIEKHLASPDLMDHHDRSAILIDRDEICSVMVNEEDHIRLQCIMPGYQLKEALEYIDRVDDIIEGQLPYAYDDNLGYLTCCPTNVGTGMRASVMMHLPGLVSTGHIRPIVQTLSKIGVAVRGLYGEGSEAAGHIYQVSNQVTLGVSEEEIVHNLEAVAKQIVDKERQARDRIAKRNPLQLEDEIWRAYGILTYARTMELKEFMDLLSRVRLGVETGIIPKDKISVMNDIMVMGQPAHLKKYVSEDSALGDLDIIRARAIRKRIRP